MFPFFQNKTSILEMEWSKNLLRKLEFRDNSESNRHRNIYSLCDVIQNFFLRNWNRKISATFKTPPAASLYAGIPQILFFWIYKIQSPSLCFGISRSIECNREWQLPVYWYTLYNWDCRVYVNQGKLKSCLSIYMFIDTALLNSYFF